MPETPARAACNSRFIRLFQACRVRCDGVVIVCGNPHETLDGAELNAAALAAYWPGETYRVAIVKAWRQ